MLKSIALIVASVSVTANPADKSPMYDSFFDVFILYTNTTKERSLKNKATHGTILTKYEYTHSKDDCLGANSPLNKEAFSVGLVASHDWVASSTTPIISPNSPWEKSKKKRS